MTSTTKSLTITLALLSGGCQGCASGMVYEEKPNQVEATAIILRSFGAPETWSPPPIFWRGPETLNCYGVTSDDGTYTTVKTDFAGGADGWMYRGLCRDGLHHGASLLEGPEWIELAWTNRTFSKSPMVHELGHAWLLHAKGDADVNHSGYFFVPGGVVEEGNRVLGAAGF